MKLNLAFRGGASKLPAYLRFCKELTSLGGVDEGVLSGCSAGGITAAAIACQYTAEEFYLRLLQMPGQNVMRWERKVEKSSNWFVKLWYGAGVAIATTAFLSDRILKYFQKSFNWSMVPSGIDLRIGFALQSELAGAAGLKSGFTAFDLYKVFKTRDAAQLAKTIFIYFAAKDGVYVFNRLEKRLVKISDDVIPLHLAVFGTMWNPIFEQVDFTINGATQNPFDGGIADNYACTAQVGEYIQVCCIEREADKPEGSLSDYYRSLAPAPALTIYLPPATKKKAFFEFTKSAIRKEWKVPATNYLS